jgi:hypothetical protein
MGTAIQVMCVANEHQWANLTLYRMYTLYTYGQEIRYFDSYRSWGWYVKEPYKRWPRAKMVAILDDMGDLRILHRTPSNTWSLHQDGDTMFIEVRG